MKDFSYKNLYNDDFYDDIETDEWADNYEDALVMASCPYCESINTFTVTDIESIDNTTIFCDYCDKEACISQYVFLEDVIADNNID